MAEQSKPEQSNQAARVIAPIALVIAVIVSIVVISSSLGGSGGGGGGAHRRAVRGTQSKQHGSGAPGKSRYVVKPGDSLSVISERTGVPVTTLTQLNPKVDPQALASGQCLKLRATGKC